MVLTLLLAMMAAAESADSTLIADAAGALGNGDTAAFLAAFDPSMPGFARLRASVSDPTTQVEVTSIEFLHSAADGSARTLEMNWQVRIVQQLGAPATTRRTGHVTCRVVTQGGKRRIVSFEPVTLLAPPDVGGAWDRLQSAIDSWLPESQRDGREARFTAFDPAMPGLDRLRIDIGAFLAMGDLHTSIDLVSDEGDDLHRAIDGNWTLEVVDANTGIQKLQRSGRVVCRLERRKKEWRIEGLEPVSFFDPPPAGR